MTRSSDICSGFWTGAMVADKSSPTFQALHQPCFHQVLHCRGPWHEELLLLIGHCKKTAGVVQVRVHLALRVASKKNKRRGKQSGDNPAPISRSARTSRPLTWHTDAAGRRSRLRRAVEVSRHMSLLFCFFALFSRLHSSLRFLL